MDNQIEIIASNAIAELRELKEATDACCDAIENLNRVANKIGWQVKVYSVKTPPEELKYKAIKHVLVVQKTDGLFWGYIEMPDGMFSPNGCGASIASLEKSVKDCLWDYLQNEGKDDAYWNKYEPYSIEFMIYNPNGNTI